MHTACARVDLNYLLLHVMEEMQHSRTARWRTVDDTRTIHLEKKKAYAELEDPSESMLNRSV